MKESELSVDVSALQQDAEYFAKRQLKKGAVGWLLLVGLGVSYVISGDFAGWNLDWHKAAGDSLLQQSSSRLCIFA